MTTTMTKSIKREKLYELVWREPMLKVAEGFGVSSSYLARVCTALRVPRPARGYWAKLEFGKNPPRPELPPLQPNDLAEWEPGAAVGIAQRATVLKRNARLETTPKPALADRQHEFLAEVRPLFLKTREPVDGILRPYKKRLVDILVSEKSLDATLNATDTLFRALETRGHHLALGASNVYARRAEIDVREVPVKNQYQRDVWSPDRLTIVRIGDVELGLTIFEMTESVEMMYMGNSKYVPVRDLTSEQLRCFKEPHFWRTSQNCASGRLALQAYSTTWMVPWVQRWREMKVGQFASMVPHIVKELESAVPELARKLMEAQVRAAEDSRKRDEELRRSQEAAEKARRDKARQDARIDLLAAIASWEQTRSIHAYFEAVDQQIEQLPPEEAKQLNGRLEEARALVGVPDALAELRRWRAPQER